MLTKEELLHKIGTLLDELREQYDTLTDPGSEHPWLDTELFEANASYFASHVRLLQKISAAQQADSRAAQPTAVYEAEAPDVAEISEDVPAVVQEVVEETTFTPATQTPAQEEQPNEAKAEERKPDVQKPSFFVPETPEAEEANDEPEIPVAKEEAASGSEPEAEEQPEDLPADGEEPTVQEITIEEKQLTITPEAPARPLTLNERLSAQRQQESAPVWQSSQSGQPAPQRVTDLKTAISLNDKLLFIRDLFNGYSLAYSEAIELLNRYDNFAEADKFLQSNYAQKNNWESKQGSVEKLYAILRKKYI